MRTRQCAVLMLVMVASFAGAPALRGSSPDDETPQVRKALDDFFVAVGARDWARVEELIADDFEFYGDDLMVLSRAEFIKAMKDDDMKIRQLEVSQVRTIVSDDRRLAWMKYRVYMDSDMRGAPYRMNSVETVAFRREGDRWRMTHNHASVRTLKDAPPAQ